MSFRFRNRRGMLVFFTMLIFPMLLQAANSADKTKEDGSKQAGKKAGDITLKVVGPKEFKAVLAKQKGKVVVVDFWATWCLPCLKNFSRSVEWSRKYPKKELVVISLSMDDSDPESKKAALTFLKKQNATIINLISSLGGEEEAMQAFEIDGGAIPHFKIYDRKGKVFKTFGGDPDNPFTHREVEAALVKALNRK